MKNLIWLMYLIMFVSIFVNLGYLFGQSILLDEAQSIWVAIKSVPTLLFLNAQDVQTPLYSLLLHLWLQFLGNDIVIARILSLIFFLFTLPLLYELIRESSREDIALLGVALYSISPFILWYSGEARTYSLLTLLTTANHLYFLRFWRSRGQTGRWGYILTAVLGLYSHYFFTFLLLSQILYVVSLYVSQLRYSPPSPTGFRRRYILSLFLIAVCFAPWLVYVIRLGTAAYTQPHLSPPTSYNVLQLFANFLFGFQGNNIQSLLVSLWPLVIMGIFLLFTHRVRLNFLNFRYFLIVTFIPVLAVFFASFIKPIFLARYLIFTAPTLFALIAWMLINYGRRLFSLATISLLLLMFGFLIYQNHSQTTPVKENYQEVVSYLNRQVTAHDIVTVSAPFTIYPIEYYYSGLARIDTIPLWDRYVQGAIPAFTQADLQTQLGTYRQRYSRLFVVLSYDQGYQTDLAEYLDHNLERLDKQTFPANIEVRTYRLRYDIPLPKTRTTGP